MPIYAWALLIGVIAGLRSMTAPAAISWAARLGWLHLADTPLAFLGYAMTPYVLTLGAIGELITDKLPKTPSRKAPPSFIWRLLMGGLSGGGVGAGHGDLAIGICLGVLGAVIGTLGGYEFRSRLG